MKQPIDVHQERPERLPGESEADFSLRMAREQTRLMREAANRRDEGREVVDAATKARAVWGS